MVNWQTTIDRKYWWTDSHLTEKKKTGSLLSVSPIQ